MIMRHPHELITITILPPQKKVIVLPFSEIHKPTSKRFTSFHQSKDKEHGDNIIINHQRSSQT
jgi:hypothetical protein